MNPAAPVKNTDREQFMDILRGISILGIFIANLHFLSLYNPNQPPAVNYFHAFDQRMIFLQAMFVEGKFYTLFSLLFGWGIALQLQKVNLEQQGATRLVKRRLWGMLLFGMMHLILLWTGDIVAFYAMLGFVLLLFRKSTDKKLLAWFVLLILSPILLYALKMNFTWIRAPENSLFDVSDHIYKYLHPAEDGPRRGVSQTSSWKEIWERTISGAFFRYGYLFFVSRIPKVLGMFLLGYYLGRNNRYKSFLQNKKLLLRIAVIGFAIGLPCNFFLAQFMENEDPYWNYEITGWYQTIVYALGVVPQALAYAACIALVYKSVLGKKLLLLFQPVGKMAFSNYILHTLVGIFTFYGVGLGLGGRYGPTAWTAFAFAVFGCQIVLSHIWLRLFHFGPIEWFWRSMTYGKWQKMLK
jgi:uncharacterized protein